MAQLVRCPDDVWLHVMEFLNFPALLRLERTCTVARAAAGRPHVWQTAHRTYWGSASLAPGAATAKASFRARLGCLRRLPALLLEWRQAADRACIPQDGRDYRAAYRQSKRAMTEALASAPLIDGWVRALAAGGLDPPPLDGAAAVVRRPGCPPLTLPCRSHGSLAESARHLLVCLNEVEMAELWRQAVHDPQRNLLELGIVAVSRIGHPDLGAEEVAALLQGMVGRLRAALPDRGGAGNAADFVPLLKRIFFHELGFRECQAPRCMEKAHEYPVDVLRNRLGHYRTLSVLLSYLAAQFGILMSLDSQPTLLFLPYPTDAEADAGCYIDVTHPLRSPSRAEVWDQVNRQHKLTFFGILEALGYAFTLAEDVPHAVWCLSGLDILISDGGLGRRSRMLGLRSGLETFRWTARYVSRRLR